jgi:beta-glucanase (GH16 family)
MKKTFVKKFLSLALCSCGLASAATYSGAEVFTSETYRYGRFEARMQMAAGSGTVSSMFLYYNDSYMGAPEPWREVDIEILGKNPNQFQSNVITGNAAQKTMSEQLHPVAGGTNTLFHTYAMEWTPTYVSWLIDGTEVRRSTDQQVIDLQEKDENLRFNLWASTSTGWVGAWNDAILPIHQYINWVRYSSYTPGAGPNGSDFTPQWKDDFDSFDYARWSTANWTFSGNRVTFSADNVTVKEGMMILSMTADPDLGHTGIVPQDIDASPILRAGRPLSHIEIQPNAMRKGNGIQFRSLGQDSWRDASGKIK